MCSPHVMQVALRKRLRLPRPITARRCGSPGCGDCGGNVDTYGDHAAACPRTGLLAPGQGGGDGVGAGTVGGAVAVAHDGAWGPSRRSAPIGSQRLYTVLRWVSLCAAISPGSVADGGGKTQADSLPRARAGRPAEAGRARGRRGRLLEWRRAAVRQRYMIRLRASTVRQSAAAGWARRWWSVLSVGASSRWHHCPWPSAPRFGRLGLHAAGVSATVSPLPMRP